MTQIKLFWFLFSVLFVWLISLAFYTVLCEICKLQNDIMQVLIKNNAFIRILKFDISP